MPTSEDSSKKKTKKKKKPVSEVISDDVLFEMGDDEEESSTAVAIITQIDSIELPAAWGQSAAAIDEVKKARVMMTTKHGMFANVPLVCKGAECPLSGVCTIPVRNRPVSQRCPIEIGAIIELYDRYCTKLGVGPEDYFDQSQVKDLVDTEIKLLRANGYLAIDADFIQQVVAEVDRDGNVHTKPELHKATDYEHQLLARKRQILGDLMATRKAKGEETKVADPSSFAANLMQKAMKAAAMGSLNIIDADYSSVEEDEVSATPQEEGEE